VKAAIRRELGAIIAKVHRVNLAESRDSMALGGSSLFMKELTEKLSFIKTEVLSRYSLGEAGQEWYAGLYSSQNLISICSLTSQDISYCWLCH
jgi:hypothetical protein